MLQCCSVFFTGCLTCWCPCITFGRIADIVDKGSKSKYTVNIYQLDSDGFWWCLIFKMCGMVICVAATGFSEVVYALIANLIGCGCLYSYPYRTKIRQQYMLEETPCGDCLVHFCCEPCALCQEYRELEARGFDMTIG